ncbi:MAG: hypothetical protein O3A55_04585 [Bacteroidetes bacterium]|nr:hypothetical protein [Bacteroidota bacterium]
MPVRQGWWKFDDAANVLKADAGSALELVGTNQAIAGPDVGNGAVKIGVGSESLQCRFSTETHDENLRLEKFFNRKSYGR